ncbi:MAG: hypothetical protein FWG63_03605 [Defluviitaleaceae bacterium]|nr:hypothetical protein [Defluviitaleaceae bacterium]
MVNKTKLTIYGMFLFIGVIIFFSVYSTLERHDIVLEITPYYNLIYDDNPNVYIQMRLTNYSSGTFMYGLRFDLYRKENAGWVRVSQKENVAIIDLGLVLYPYSYEVFGSIDLNRMFGNIAYGHYRISKSITSRNSGRIHLVHDEFKVGF